MGEPAIGAASRPSVLSRCCRSNGVTPADWYADPADPSMLRYWDGTAWTQHRHPAISQLPAPDDAVSRVLPVVEPDLATERVEQLTDHVSRKLAEFAPTTVEPAWCEDPMNRLQARWWDGASWTGRVATRPIDSVPVVVAEPVAKGDLGREDVHWPSPRESRYLNRCAPTAPGWYADPLAPALRARMWEGAWSEQVRPRRHVVTGQPGTNPVTSGATSRYGDPEDIARTERSLVAWGAVGALLVVVGVASLFDPRNERSLAPAILGIGALVRAYFAHSKLRSLGRR